MELILISAVTSWIVAKLFDQGIKIVQKYMKKEDKPKKDKDKNDKTK